MSHKDNIQSTSHYGVCCQVEHVCDIGFIWWSEPNMKKKKEKKSSEDFCIVLKEILGDKVVKVVVFDRIVDSPCCLVTGDYGWRELGSDVWWCCLGKKASSLSCEWRLHHLSGRNKNPAVRKLKTTKIREYFWHVFLRQSLWSVLLLHFHSNELRGREPRKSPKCPSFSASGVALSASSLINEVFLIIYALDPVLGAFASNRFSMMMVFFIDLFIGSFSIGDGFSSWRPPVQLMHARNGVNVVWMKNECECA